jgi:hypothetical protein
MMLSRPIRLSPADTARYARLRLQMLTQAPWAFSADPGDDMALDVAGLATILEEEENAIFAIEDGYSSSLATGVPSQDRDGRRLVAAAGIYRMTRPKFAHRAKIWGVFVDPDHRGQGFGRAVVSAAVDLARSWSGVDYIDLGVSENAPEALHLYESLGFKIWGREPASTSYEGQRYDEIYMTLKV